MTDAWDPSIPEHKALAHEIELGNGIPEMRSLKLARSALTTVGFEVEYEEDLAERKDHVEWYYPLEGDYSKAQTVYDLFTVWRTTWFGMFVMHNIFWFLELIGVLPKGTIEVGAALKVAQTSLIKGGQTKVSFCLPVWDSLDFDYRSYSCSHQCILLSVGNLQIQSRLVVLRSK